MKKQKSKKAQIRVQETAFVLLALVLLAIIVFIFYSRFQYSKLQSRLFEIRQEAARGMLEKIAGMPELRCSGLLAGVEKALCIDRDKADILSKTAGYEKFWQGLAEVRLIQIYPAGPEIKIYSADKGNLSYSTFLNLCSQKAETFDCAIGKLVLTTK